MTYDPKCEELARHFLDYEVGVTEDVVKVLAAEIQNCIEDFIEGWK